MTFSVACCHLTYSVERMVQVYLALSPEPGLLARISLGQAPFLQTLRLARSPPPLVRVLPRYYGLVRLPAIVRHGCTSILDHADLDNGPRPIAGSPGFRARSLGTCMGSATTWSLGTSCKSDVSSVAFRTVPSRRHSKAYSFAAQYPAHTCPCQRLPQPLTGKQP